MMDKRDTIDKATVISKPRNGHARQATATGKRPEKFTYALAAYTAERRDNGWYVSKTVASFCNEKPKWSGPFQDIEHACLSIARHCATELADRHTRSIESYGIERTDSLFGLKPTTRLRVK